MSLKPNKLIVCANLDDLQTKRREIVSKYEGTSEFVKWSDFAVELKDKLFILKVINMPTGVLDNIRGYNEVEFNHLIAQIENFVKEAEVIGNVAIMTTSEATPEATEAPENKEKVDNNVNTAPEQENAPVAE